MIEFTGRIAVVTGAGGGIGRSVCLGLAKAGAKVVVVDIDPAIGEETLRLVRAQGGEGRFVRADVTQSADVENYVNEAVRAYGRIDVFINNAGWEGMISPLTDYPDDQFDKLIAINVRGVFLGLKHVLRVMVKQGSGAIVNTASLAAYIGSPKLGPYNASKHAVMGLTKAAAVEVASTGVRVNAVCPGPVDTRMMESIQEGRSPGSGLALRAKTETMIPDGRYATPDEVANLMMYLASDLSTHITGQGVQINGGVNF